MYLKQSCKYDNMLIKLRVIKILYYQALTSYFVCPNILSIKIYTN